MPWPPSSPPRPLRQTSDALTTVVGTKATTAALNQLQTTVANKADQADLDAANAAIQDRVDVETYTVRQTSIDQQLGTKYQLPAGGIPQATLDSSTRTKIDRGDAAKTTVDAATATAAATSLVKTDGSGLFTVSPATAAAHPYQKSQVDNLLNLKVSTTDLTPLLAAKTDLVGGKIPTSQIPAIATHETYAVANRAAMLALTPAQVQIGDVAIITGTADQGTYTLITADPTNFNNWLKHLSPADVVQSVNGYQGTIVLNAADVGARSASVAIPLADVSGLSAALAAKADTTYVNTQVATRTTPTQVTDQVSQLGTSKLAVDLAATGPVGSLSGQQSIDSTIAPLDSSVLLPMQNSSTQNGIWIVKTGAWVRATDMASGSSLMPYTLVAVKGGATNIDSLWQVTTTAPVTVDSAAQNYAKILRGGLPKTYTGGNGVGHHRHRRLGQGGPRRQHHRGLGRHQARLHRPGPGNGVPDPGGVGHGHHPARPELDEHHRPGPGRRERGQRRCGCHGHRPEHRLGGVSSPRRVPVSGSLPSLQSDKERREQS